MSRFFKTNLILLFILIFSLSFSFVQATSEELESEPTRTSEISDELPEETITEEENTDTVTEETTSDSLSTLSTSSVTKVSNVNSYEQANLQLNNILSIILISIGVLLILFAIAILIRLKR